MTIVASLGLVELSESDSLVFTLTSPDPTEDMSASNWKVQFSDNPNHTNLVGPTFKSSDGSIITTGLTPGPSVATFTVNPDSQGLIVPIDLGGRYKDHINYYFDVLQIFAGGLAWQTRARCVLQVDRAITRPTS